MTGVQTCALPILVKNTKMINRKKQIGESLYSEIEKKFEGIPVDVIDPRLWGKN